MGFLDELREIDRQVNGQDSKQEKNGCENTPGMNGCENTPGMNGYGNTPGMNGYGNALGMNGYGNTPGMNGYGNALGMNGYGNTPGMNGYENTPGMNGYGNTPGMNGYGNNPGMNGYGNTPGINGYENYKKEMKPAGNFLEQIKAEIGESPEKVQKREQERKNEELIEAFMEEIRMVMLSKARSRDYYTPYNCQDKIIETDITNLSSFKKLFPDSRVDLKGFLRTPEFNLAYSYKRKPAEELFEKLKIRAGLDGIYLSLRPDCVKARITLPED